MSLEKIMDKNYCRNCRYYKEFYIKSLSSFEKSGFGICRKANSIVNQKDYCEIWVDNEVKRKMRVEISTRKLDEALTSIIELKQIFKEEKEEQ